MTRLTAPAAEVLRIVADPRTPVFLTALTGGRPRYGYWRPADHTGGAGGCFVALPTEVCEDLRSTGRITLGTPVSDPGKTTYRVSESLKKAEEKGRARSWAA
ncbi:hypothetical protein [Streptomyces sp. NPDC003635]